MRAFKENDMERSNTFHGKKKTPLSIFWNLIMRIKYVWKIEFARASDTLNR